MVEKGRERGVKNPKILRTSFMMIMNCLKGLSREEENAAEVNGLAQPQDAVEEDDGRVSFPPPILPHVSVCPEVSPVTEDPPDSPDMRDSHDGGGANAFDDSEFVGGHVHVTYAKFSGS